MGLNSGVKLTQHKNMLEYFNKQELVYLRSTSKILMQDDHQISIPSTGHTFSMIQAFIGLNSSSEEVISSILHTTGQSWYFSSSMHSTLGEVGRRVLTIAILGKAGVERRAVFT